MKRIFLVLIFHLSCSVLHAQFSVSGMVIDSLGSTPLLGEFAADGGE
jgi:hypothetical protein